MKPQFSHEIFLSFYYWFEAQLLSSKIEAYKTDEDNRFLFTDFDDVPSGWLGYQGKFRQLVTESNVSKMNSGFFVGSSFISGADTGHFIDYVNGRIIVPESVGTGANITANNTVREINVYPTEDDEEQILLTSDFIDTSNPDSTYLSASAEKRGIKTYLLPACFIQYVTSDNDRLAFGGEDDTQTRIHVVVVGTDNYQVDGVLSFFADKEDTCLPMIPYEDNPYGIFNSIKSFPYSYAELASGQNIKSFIKNVTTSKVKGAFSSDKIQKHLIIGFMDFDLSTYRFPRLI